MKHKHFGSAALMVAIGAHALAGGPILIDDFNDGDDRGWIHIDFTEGFPYGPGTYVVSSGSYRMYTHLPVPSNQFNVVSAGWAESADPYYSEGTVQGKLRSQSSQTNPAIVLRWSTVDNTGYACGAEVGMNKIFIQRVDCAVIDSCPPYDDDIIFAPITEVIDVGEDWMFKASAIGSEITLKVWPAGAPEPAAPQVTMTDSTYAQGLFGVGGAHPVGPSSPIDMTVDDVVFIPPPAPGDLDGDGDVDAADLAQLLSAWTPPGGLCLGCFADLNGDGAVDAADLAVLLSNWG